MKTFSKQAVMVLAFVVPAIGYADEDTLTKEDQKNIVAERANDKDDDHREAMWLEDDQINLKTGEVKVTNKDRTRKQNALSDLAEADSSYRYFPMMQRKQKGAGCDAHPEVKIDMAVIKNTPAGTSLPFDQVFEGLFTACANPPNEIYRAWVKKIKVIHFTVTNKLDHGNFVLKFNDKTSELTVGTSNYLGAADIAAKTAQWVGKQ